MGRNLLLKFRHFLESEPLNREMTATELALWLFSGWQQHFDSCDALCAGDN